MVRLLVFILLFFPCGCQNTTSPHALKNVSELSLALTPKPPAFEIFKHLYSQPYVLYENNCQDKCLAYAAYLLISEGLVAHVLGVDYDGPNKTKYIFVPDRDAYAIEGHAIVRVLWKGSWLYCDPTNFTWSRDLTDYAPAGEKGITQVISLIGMIEK